MGMRYVYYKNHKRKRQQRLLKLTRCATYLCVDMGLLSSTAHSQSFRGSDIIFAAITTTATILITNCYSNGSDSPHCRWHTYRSYLSGALMCTPIENMVQLGRFWPTWVCLPNGISIVSAVLQGSPVGAAAIHTQTRTHTDTQTNHETDNVSSNRLHSKSKVCHTPWGV